MITIDQVNETRAKLKNLKANASGIISVKMAIENLEPEISKKLKAGLSYREIAEVIYDSLGLDETHGKRENFWRSLVKYHKTATKAATKPRRKTAQVATEVHHSQSQDASGELAP